MKLKNIIIPLLLAIVSFTSCKDVWEEHYNQNSKTSSSLNLYDYIKSQPDLSIFAKMIQIAGFDTILNQPQTYTVWAPVNSSLESIDLIDTTLVKDMVKNHISRFSYTTSEIVSKTIFMLDAKFLTFRLEGDGYTFGGKALLKSDISTSNGILHTINGYVPYLSNIWEFIGKTQGLDSLKSYLYSQSTSVFDEAASAEIGTNEQNQAIYDSVIIFSNPILDKIGQLQKEDSTFAAILPNNTAWTKVYDLVKSN
ncbi:MAG: fasciclin domain-containing protein, partial [Paludibacter sp.]